MDDPSIDEIPGDDADLAAILTAAGLPVADLGEPGRRFFRFREQDRLIGFIGWEAADERSALLRSLVVVPPQRGRGIGQAMTRWALTRCAELGFTEVYVLTTTAEGLAHRLGFAAIDRAAAPPAIGRSRQFAGLCPASAVLLLRRLP